MKTEEEVLRKFRILDAELDKDDEALGFVICGDGYRDHVISFLSALGWVLEYDPTDPHEGGENSQVSGVTLICEE